MTSRANPSFTRCDVSTWNKLVWAAAAPLRLHATRQPDTSFKRFVSRRVLPKLLPPAPAHLMTQVPGGGRVRIDCNEEIALLLLMHGAYEAVELQTLVSLTRKGTTAIDVGANVGMYTVALSTAVGADGRVIALEPVPSTVDKLRVNLQRNGLTNVDVVVAAAAEQCGTMEMHLATDSAYTSLVTVKSGRADARSLPVEVITLDTVWDGAGRPDVSVCKIDVEGAERAVLDGSRALLKTCRPALLLEADEGRQLDSLVAALAPLGYERHSPPGFSPWNHLFVCRR